MSSDHFWRRAAEMRRAAQILLNRAAELEEAAIEQARANRLGAAIVLVRNDAQEPTSVGPLRVREFNLGD